MKTYTRLENGQREVCIVDNPTDSECIKTLVATFGLHNIVNISLRRPDGSLCMFLFQDICFLLP